MADLLNELMKISPYIKQQNFLKKKKEYCYYSNFQVSEKEKITN